MEETLNKKIGKEEEVFYYAPDDKEKSVVQEIFNLFRDTADQRNRAFEYFDNRNLIDYINDSVVRFVTNKDVREDIEDWQARVFDPFTRNKVIAILGKVVSVMPIPEYIASGDEDYRREQMLNDLVSYVDSLDDTEELMFYALLEALVKGTVVGYEGYEEKEKAIRDIVNYDSGDKIDTKDGKLKIRRLFGSIVPLEDFYPSSVGIRKIKDMPYCFWRTVMSLPQFKMKCSQYKKAKYVQGNSNWSGEEGNRPFYLDYISEGVDVDRVEVIKYYNQDTDEFIVIANGIWLNPLGENKVMPIPFNHKTLPFWKAIYEPFGADFFYGKSLPDKLKAMQDVINVLHNMLLDQSFLSIFSPILVSGNDDIEDDFLRPGRRIPVDDPNAYKQLQIQAPQGFHQYIFEYTKRVLEETSIDPVSQGIAGAGERVTATEINRAAIGVMSILSLFAQFFKWGVKDKGRLRAKNILQFFTGPMIERVLGEGESREYKKAFNVFKIDDTVLTSGKRGMKIIEMYSSKGEMPTRKELKVRARIKEGETGRRTEIIAINPDYIRDFEFDVKVVPNPRTQESKSMEKALWLEKSKVYMELFGDIVDREELALQGAEIFGDKPEKIFKRDMFQQKPQIPQQGQFPQAGNLGISENMMRSVMGNEGITSGARNLKQMMK